MLEITCRTNWFTTCTNYKKTNKHFLHVQYKKKKLQVFTCYVHLHHVRDQLDLWHPGYGIHIHVQNIKCQSFTPKLTHLMRNSFLFSCKRHAKNYYTCNHTLLIAFSSAALPWLAFFCTKQQYVWHKDTYTKSTGTNNQCASNHQEKNLSDI